MGSKGKEHGEEHREGNAVCGSSRKVLWDISNATHTTNDGDGEYRLTVGSVRKYIALHEINLISEELFQVVVKQGRTSKRGIGRGEERGGVGQEEGGVIKGGPEGIVGCNFNEALGYGVHEQPKGLRRREHKGVTKLGGRRGLEHHFDQDKDMLSSGHGEMVWTKGATRERVYPEAGTFGDQSGKRDGKTTQHVVLPNLNRPQSSR
ncbi:hypothetical protein LIER_10222 [Lithospermum erythrorhizon]|uniref:Uncharacterized protein n=1 Tax=Lithospermum erythrorhizon TaxID=34254 RepID=A0AAV3PMS0_LITER